MQYIAFASTELHQLAVIDCVEWIIYALETALLKQQWM